MEHSEARNSPLSGKQIFEHIRRELSASVPEALGWRETQDTLSSTASGMLLSSTVIPMFLGKLDLFRPQARKVLEVVLPYAQDSSRSALLSSAVAKDLTDIIELVWPLAPASARAQALISAASNVDSGVLAWALERAEFSQVILGDALASAVEVGFDEGVVRLLPLLDRPWGILPKIRDKERAGQAGILKRFDATLLAAAERGSIPLPDGRSLTQNFERDLPGLYHFTRAARMEKSLPPASPPRPRPMRL